MKIDREELLAAVKAANEVVVSKHNVLLFTKVWLLDGSVLAFNNLGMVLQVPIDMPPLGGVDGGVLESLLKGAMDDDVVIEATDSGQARIVSGRSTTKLAVIDPSNYVSAVQEVPVFKNPIELAVADLIEEIELGAMLKIKEIKGDPKPDFGCVTVHARAGNLILYTSDRASINRSILKIDDSTECEFLVSLAFMQSLKKMGHLFGEGDLSIGDGFIMVKNEAGAMMYTKLTEVEQPINFKTAVGKLWPEGKINIKTLVDLPDDFAEALARATAVVGKNDRVDLHVVGGEMRITAAGNSNQFEEVLPFDHPDAMIRVTPGLITQSLPLVDRIYISSIGVALFGPKRFSRFIAGRS